MASARSANDSMTDVLVWELVSVRCALGQPIAEPTRNDLRKQERALVGALLDMGVLSQQAIAPLPHPATVAMPMY